MKPKNDNADNHDVFQELYELILDEASGKKTTRKRQGQDHYEFTPSATDFLENEAQRLAKLNLFFGTKMSNLREHSQIAGLIEHQEQELFRTKGELLSKFENSEVPLKKQLAYIWDKTFG